MKEKNNSFFANLQEINAESQPRFGTLPISQHSSQRFIKVFEPNLADLQKIFIE